MESLAQAAIIVVLSSAVIGSALGCGIGYLVHKYAKISKLRCLLIGGIAGIPVGLFVLTQFARF